MKKASKVSQKLSAAEMPLTEREMQLVEASDKKNVRASGLLRFRNCGLTTDGVNETEDHTIALEQVREVLKIDHIDTAVNAIAKAAAGMSTKKPDVSLTMALQLLSGFQPQNQLETMLLGQMIQVNTAAATCMANAFDEGQTIAGKELNANLAIKFQRTFVAQIEALQKLRGKGGQKVTVEHVHVHEGGQAIVGNISHTPPGGKGKNEN